MLLPEASRSVISAIGAALSLVTCSCHFGLGPLSLPVFVFPRGPPERSLVGAPCDTSWQCGSGAGRMGPGGTRIGVPALALPLTVQPYSLRLSFACW